MKLQHLATFLMSTSGVMVSALASAAQPKHAVPGLAFLATLEVITGTPIQIGTSPLVPTRLTVPITGGSFTGPKLSGTVLPGGADWGIVDSQGKFHVDARYNLRTSDGADIYVRASGAQQEDDSVLGTVVLETGHAGYAWVNGALVVDVSRPSEDGKGVVIDLFLVSAP